MDTFSTRFGHRPAEAPITVRDDAPMGLRAAIVQIAYDLGSGPSELRGIFCRALKVQPNSSNWSEFPNVDGEVNDLIQSCPWYRVYDIAEAIFRTYASRGLADRPTQFEAALNEYFVEYGIGWKMVDGVIQSRGPESFEATLNSAVDTLDSASMVTARGELHEALLDLSRRPSPDLTGALQHAMAALEAVAREVVGDPRATLGEILNRYPGTIPRPLDMAVEKAWGYASERGRHLREGNAPTHEEVELVVGIAATVATYLARKHTV